jgi:hydrogenase expression/formation protein HypD
MKYIDEFRDGELALGIAAAIAAEADPGRSYNLMEFCGGHTHAISRYGVTDLLPPAVRMIHGPGCPVCVLPIGRIDLAIRLALDEGVIVASYGDCLRVPASDNLSLLKAKARGGDVRMVYSPADALKIAAANPEREVVFLAIGFETTTPPTALVIKEAARAGATNFSVLCNHVLTPAAITNILDSPEVRRLGTLPLDGFVGPAHVSTVIGSRPYEFFAEEYAKPVVIAGFEPLDILAGLVRLVEIIASGKPRVDNAFPRCVTREGNREAQAVLWKVFRPTGGRWRGIAHVPNGNLRLRDEFAAWDARKRFRIDVAALWDHAPPTLVAQCQCGDIMSGIASPHDCALFGRECTPDAPVGACMVSAEGTCRIWHQYGGHPDLRRRAS